jgi:hypothetical protein
LRVVKRAIRHTSRADIIRIFPLGDVHIGAHTCDEKAFRATVDEIKADPHAYWVGMGDFCEFINRSDKRFRVGGLAPWVREFEDIAAVQRDRFLANVLPIADKCLVMLKGNHEDTIHTRYERAIFDEIVAGVKDAMTDPPEYLGVGVSGWMRLRVERGQAESRKAHTWGINVYMHHGFGGGQLAGGKALKLERVLGRFDCDLAFVGHWHTRESVRFVAQGITRQGRIYNRNRVAVATGAWVQSLEQGAETYAERKGYPATAVGCPVVHLNPNKREIKALV